MSETLVIDRMFKDVGRINRRSGTTKPAVRDKINRLLTDLADAGRLDILRAIRDGKVTMMAVYSASRTKSLDSLPVGAASGNLADEMREWVEKLRVPADVSKKHKESLETSRRYFERAQPDATIADLPALLEKLFDSLGAEHPRSFNLARSAALAFTRAKLKKTHPLYIGCAAVERRKRRYGTTKKGKALSIEAMRRFFPNPDTDHVDDCAWSMATTGMGGGEYWGRWQARTDRVHIDGTKRKGRVRDVPLMRTPVVPTMHRRTFDDAVRDRTERKVVPYDLRRTYAHWLELAGVPRTRRRMYLGHGTGDVTELYERHEVDEYLEEDGRRLRELLSSGTVASEPREPKKQKRSRLYLIQNAATGSIKIGIARDPLARLNDLQVASAQQLTLLGTLPGGRTLEQEAHRRFAAHHIRGEWFKNHPEIHQWFRSQLTAPKPRPEQVPE